MNAERFRVHTEQLLVPIGTRIYNLNVRTFEPASAIGTVVCFHRFDGSGNDFDMLATFLASNGYRVVCPDMFGRGDSAFLLSPETYTLKAVVEGAAAVLARYGTGQIDIAAEGWGALIALLARRLARSSVKHWLCLDLALDYDVDSDAAIARALDAALDGAHHHFDPAIINAVDGYRGRSFDIRPMLRAAGGRLLFAFRSSKEALAAEALRREVSLDVSLVIAGPSPLRSISRGIGTRLLEFLRSRGV